MNQLKQKKQLKQYNDNVKLQSNIKTKMTQIPVKPVVAKKTTKSTIQYDPYGAFMAQQQLSEKRGSYGIDCRDVDAEDFVEYHFNH